MFRRWTCFRTRLAFELCALRAHGSEAARAVTSRRAFRGATRNATRVVLFVGIPTGQRNGFGQGDGRSRAATTVKWCLRASRLTGSPRPDLHPPSGGGAFGGNDPSRVSCTRSAADPSGLGRRPLRRRLRRHSTCWETFVPADEDFWRTPTSVDQSQGGRKPAGEVLRDGAGASCCESRRPLERITPDAAAAFGPGRARQGSRIAGSRTLFVRSRMFRCFDHPALRCRPVSALGYRVHTAVSTRSAMCRFRAFGSRSCGSQN